MEFSRSSGMLSHPEDVRKGGIWAADGELQGTDYALAEGTGDYRARSRRRLECENWCTLLLTIVRGYQGYWIWVRWIYPPECRNRTNMKVMQHLTRAPPADTNTKFSPFERVPNPAREESSARSPSSSSLSDSRSCWFPLWFPVYMTQVMQFCDHF